MTLWIPGQLIVQLTLVEHMAIVPIVIVILLTILMEPILTSATLTPVTWSLAPPEIVRPMTNVLCCTRHAQTISANRSPAHLQQTALQKRMVQELPDTVTLQLELASNASVPTLLMSMNH